MSLELTNAVKVERQAVMGLSSVLAQTGTATPELHRLAVAVKNVAEAVAEQAVVERELLDAPQGSFLTRGLGAKEITKAQRENLVLRNSLLARDQHGDVVIDMDGNAVGLLPEAERLAEATRPRTSLLTRVKKTLSHPATVLTAGLIAGYVAATFYPKEEVQANFAELVRQGVCQIVNGTQFVCHQG